VATSNEELTPIAAEGEEPGQERLPGVELGGCAEPGHRGLGLDQVQAHRAAERYATDLTDAEYPSPRVPGA
jgi:hypothetical protein